MVERQLKKVVEQASTGQVSAVESNVLVECKQESGSHVVHSLVVTHRITFNFLVLHHYSVQNLLQLLLFLLSETQSLLRKKCRVEKFLAYLHFLIRPSLRLIVGVESPLYV